MACRPIPINSILFNNDKLEKIQERALRILYQDHNSSYDDLLEMAGTSTIIIQRLRLMTLTVFESLNSLNPPCLNDIFTKKCMPYSLRDSSIIEQPKRRTTTFGLRSFSYAGAKLWNELPNYVKEMADLSDFKRTIYALNWTDSWPRLSPGCKPVCPYCIMHWSRDIVNGEISVAGCTGGCNSDSPRCGE